MVGAGRRETLTVGRPKPRKVRAWRVGAQKCRAFFPSPVGRSFLSFGVFLVEFVAAVQGHGIPKVRV